jgi:hypothetical protein
MQAEDMLQHVQGKVFPFLKDLNGTDSKFTYHMRNAVFIIPKPALLVEAVKTIDDIFEVMERDSRENGQAFQDIQGDVMKCCCPKLPARAKTGSSAHRATSSNSWPTWCSRSWATKLSTRPVARVAFCWGLTNTS